jgi:hypothetical protein
MEMQFVRKLRLKYLKQLKNLTKYMNEFDHCGDIRPVKMIYHRFQFHPDFPKWMAENKPQIMEAERRMLAEFARFITDSDMNIEQTVDLFLSHYENR